MNQPKDWTQLPLSGAGRSLIEASAGTGKTWTIAVLYLRLLLEEHVSPKQIIVSTFTKAAASELTERLRNKLQWALAEANHANTRLDDATLPADSAWIHQRWRNAPDVRKDDVQRLQAALADFDAAPISTLHSLCARILADHPFAAGTLFRAGEMVSGKALEAALEADLWRVIAQGAPSDELVQLARDAKANRSMLKKYIPVLVQPNVEVGCLDPVALRDRLGFLGDLDAWASKVRDLLDNDSWFNKRCVLRQTWRNLVDTLAPMQGVVPGEIDLARLIDAPKLTAISKAGINNPDIQALANVSVEIVAAIPDVEWDRVGNVSLRNFLAAAQRWCLAAMQARLDAANQSTFDQLLLKVRAALQPRDGQRALADALFAAWPVALVDEFQDTDPVQFGILDAIYRDSENQARGRLVMIGDPKQAIYRFRGGDVQAYERAKAAVPKADRLTLRTNHRSSRGYVDAVNQFYAATGTRLGPAQSHTTIAYDAVLASGRRDDQPLCFAADHAQVARPLVLHRLAPDDDAHNLEMYALRTCAGQIVQALSPQGYCIGEKPLEPGDIAVLLPGHAQIAKLAAMLKARGVPCVVASQTSVFDTDIARELRIVLHAALHPDDPRTLRAALATRLCGIRLGALRALRADPAAWDAHASHFHTLRHNLDVGGPLALVAALLEQQATRLLATVEGERMLTDLRHLGELLQEAWVDCGSGERLLAWFADQMDDGSDSSDAADARALRLESDAKRVKLMTLHASKGLEFNVVFLPLMWRHTRPKIAERSPYLLADADGCIKCLIEGPAKNIVIHQEYEERFRILYVALTRAVYACHVYALPESGTTKPIEDARKAKDVPLNTLNLSAFAANPDVTAIALIEGWDADAGQAWYADKDAAAIRQARPLPAAPHGPLPMRHSFTTLSGGGRHRMALEDEAAEDEMLTDQTHAIDDQQAAATIGEDTPALFHEQLDALTDVAGADFGNAVHALFEHRVPGQPFAQATVLAALREYGVRPNHGELDTLATHLTTRLQTVLETSLDRSQGPCLAHLSASDMCAEMEFNYMLDGASLRALRKACEAHGESGLVPVREQTLAGLMNGKIDLIFAHGGRFHVLDYKGNRLASGPRSSLQDYAPEAIKQTMLTTGYRFQALLYTVALERYLRERLGAHYQRSQHLGDCWYLFVRAVGLTLPDGTPCGVWHHRFTDDLLDAVQGVLGLSLQEAA